MLLLLCASAFCTPSQPVATKHLYISDFCATEILWRRYRSAGLSNTKLAIVTPVAQYNAFPYTNINAMGNCLSTYNANGSIRRRTKMLFET